MVRHAEYYCSVKECRSRGVTFDCGIAKVICKIDQGGVYREYWWAFLQGHHLIILSMPVFPLCPHYNLSFFPPIFWLFPLSLSLPPSLPPPFSLSSHSISIAAFVSFSISSPTFSNCELWKTVY